MSRPTLICPNVCSHRTRPPSSDGCSNRALREAALAGGIGADGQGARRDRRRRSGPRPPRRRWPPTWRRPRRPRRPERHRSGRGSRPACWDSSSPAPSSARARATQPRPQTSVVSVGHRSSVAAPAPAEAEPGCRGGRTACRARVAGHAAPSAPATSRSGRLHRFSADGDVHGQQPARAGDPASLPGQVPGRELPSGSDRARRSKR